MKRILLIGLVLLLIGLTGCVGIGSSSYYCEDTEEIFGCDKVYKKDCARWRSGVESHHKCQSNWELIPDY